MLTLKIDNLESLRDAFIKAPAKIAPILQKATIEAGKVLQRTEVLQAPHKTGGLQRSIKMVYKPISVEIYPSIDYAMWIVSGTRPHVIFPSRAKALRFKGKDGQIHYAKRVMHTGTQPNDFVGRTVDIATVPVNKIFNNALLEVAKIIQ